MGSSSRIGARLKKTCHRRTHFLGLVILYVFGSVIVRQFNTWQTPKLENDFQINNDNNAIVGRKLLSIGNDNTTQTNSTPKCTKPSIEEFPRDIFSDQERKYGAVLLHVVLAIYMFLALAFVCDDYFISSLDKICEHFDLSEDVAGATFMAAGSSAPELFTAIIGVFVAKGDVGVGTIVGSAVFNILVIIALCALFAGQVIQLTWWPLFRDSVYYIIAITALILTLYDGTVRWYESMIMIFLYFGYILLMKFNPMIVKRINNREKMRKAISERVDNAQPSDHRVEEGLEGKVSVKYVDGGRRMSATELSEDPEDGGHEMKEQRARITWKELGLMIMLSDKFPPTTRFRAACLMVIHREDRKRMLMQKNADEAQQVVESDVCSNDDKGKGEISLLENTAKLQHDSSSSSSSTEGGGGGGATPFLYPHGSPFKVIFWLLTLPLVTILYFTIPDCRKPRWESWWLVTFLLSIFWIMVFSYFMVWMVCVIGFTLGVPDVIMGIIFLAAGTSIPDAISSLLVAREGMGDMAVSNSIGSNIFDILIGLAVPWFLKTAIVTPGVGVKINSNGMVYSVGLLFISVVITVLSIYCNKWRLDVKLGVFFTLIYFVFVTLSACIEFNLFVFVNHPTCAYDG